MRHLSSKKRGTRGVVLILLLLMLPIFLIPMVGLAIDGTMVMLVQTKLSAAADGAVLGAGRLLGTQANTTEIAGEFLNVNFPSGYWGAQNLQSNITATDVNGMHTITISASAQVPLLFMRVLGKTYSTVGAYAQATRRDLRMMIVVDRSGSVVDENAQGTIISVLNQYVADSATSVFVDGRDLIGMVSFGATWRLDFSPTVYFQSSNPNIGTAVNNLPFDTGSGTNTAEGLYQAWYQLRYLNQTSPDPAALNVILMLTDGRPTAITGTYTSTAHCSSSSHPGALQAAINLGPNNTYPPVYPFWPPPTSYPGGNVAVFGLLDQQYEGIPEMNSNGTPGQSIASTNPNGCYYNSQGQTSVWQDIPSIPNNAGPIDNVGSISTYTLPGVPTQSQGYYLNYGNSTTNPLAIRYAAFNVADNIATLIRTDTVINPVLFVIGLSYAEPNPNTGMYTEPLDSDWLARIANDQSYTIQTADPDAQSYNGTKGTTVGNPVFQSGQTAGWYCLSNLSTLGACFQNAASQVLRLAQ